MNNSSVILVFDLTALLGSGTREWQEFKKVGSCCLPEVVIEEMEFLCKRAPDIEQETKAREFSRFLPTSNWATTAIYWEHPLLQSQEGEQLSKNARLQQAIAKAVYALSQQNPEQLVVFVVNNQRLREQVESLQIPNLCTLTVTALLQWIRTNQRPINVAQKSQLLKTGAQSADNPSGETRATVSTPSSQTRTFKGVTKKPASPLPALIAMILSLGSFGIVGLAIWFLVNPVSFQQFWDKTGLPSLPKN